MKPQKVFNRTIDAGPEPPLIQFEAGIEQSVQNKVPQNKGEEALRRLAVVRAPDPAGAEILGQQSVATFQALAPQLACKNGETVTPRPR